MAARTVSHGTLPLDRGAKARVTGPRPRLSVLCERRADILLTFTTPAYTLNRPAQARLVACGSNVTCSAERVVAPNRHRLCYQALSPSVGPGTDRYALAHARRFLASPACTRVGAVPMHLCARRDEADLPAD